MTLPIGSLYSTKIPDLGDIADIQEALRVYHYGASSGSGIGQYDINNTDPELLENPSVAYSFHDLQTQIDTITATASIPISAFTVKGSLLVGTGASTYAQLPVGSNGFVLTANSGATNGIEWALPEVTLTNTVTFTNKTLTSPVITTPKTYIGFTPSTGTNYLLVATDADKLVTLSNASANTVTIPNGVFFLGQYVNIQQIGDGQTTIQGDGTTTFTGTGTKLRTKFSAATIICTGTNTFTAVGDLV
jgi:hypothetical protein